MKMTRLLATALIFASGPALPVAQAQQPGITRTDLQRHDLSVPGFESIQVRVGAEKGGYFAAREQPEFFASELRAVFRPLRGS